MGPIEEHLSHFHEVARCNLVRSLRMVTEPSDKMIQAYLRANPNPKPRVGSGVTEVEVEDCKYLSTRTDDTLAAWVAAPFWAIAWVLTFGRFGKPLWRTA